MHQYVKSAGAELVKDQENIKEPVMFIRKLMELRDSFEKIVVEGFKADKLFQLCLKEVSVNIVFDTSICFYFRFDCNIDLLEYLSPSENMFRLLNHSSTQMIDALSFFASLLMIYLKIN